MKVDIARGFKSGDVGMDEAVNNAAWWQSMPNKNEYAAMERYYQGLGRDLGLTPAQTQASAWVGGGKITGLASDESKPFVSFVEDRVNVTAKARGMEPREVLRRFVRGEMPLLGVAGASAAALLPYAAEMAGQSQPQQAPPPRM
jgi:hypothetical protein